MRKTEIMTVSIPKELKKQLQDRANKEGRNFSNMVTYLLSKEVKKEKAA